MNMVELIQKKQAGKALSQEEIDQLIEDYTQDKIPDYQMSAWMMAVYFQGMTEEEASYLTMAMAHSGDMIDLSAIHGKKVDKHSTGGVGDTTTIILAPLVASLGIPVAKMSGRGLGHTGGTLDKLESIPGFNVEVPIDDFIDQVNRHQIAVVGQTGNLTPADKKMYALRDVTATVQSIPLIAASIMSKKIAAGADAIVLDVKVGEGAFMKTVEQAEALAHQMVQIGQQVGRKTLAVISDMNQPLGCAVGNALEIKEAIATLRGQGPKDLEELCLLLGGQMLVAADAYTDLDQAQAALRQQIQNGQALAKFKEFIEAQDGDSEVVDHPERLSQAAYQIPVLAPKSGYVAHWQAQAIGEVAALFGAGRQRTEDQIDPSVGLVIEKKIGDAVQAGEPLLVLHSQTADVDQLRDKVLAAVTIQDQICPTPTLIHEVIQA
ncbi:pyrimidine-nucleoside phosphorylase [Ignavigranum ruoffiae]|uniref:Pyrimidine-nucleoside phosphorylase n=1 Tax=Ignavigranum ruoffiae TaxID=89093 RepID=A0A1H9GRX5_9LACT|nr:pyrimidine-nucleoside phosphorylase [Ignavigranum ruoffiae]SEQ52825.1 pyrimidine-nucleoside phosphorylase [Ignavigranum ruoffiae]